MSQSLKAFRSWPKQSFFGLKTLSHGKLFIHKGMYDERMINMAKCPKCGAEVMKPRKSWKMAGRPDKSGKRLQLEIGLFDCPKCGKTFRKTLSKKKI